MKSRAGKRQRREKLEERRVRWKKAQMREKAGKSRNTVFFQWFVAPEGRKVGSLKRRVRSQLARWEMKNCTPLSCQAHLQVKKLKAPHVQTTFMEVVMSKMCTPLWLEAHFEVKMYKKTHVRIEKVHAVVARSCAKHISKSKCRKHFPQEVRQGYLEQHR
jgi:hypothetical protein